MKATEQVFPRLFFGTYQYTVQGSSVVLSRWMKSYNHANRKAIEYYFPVRSVVQQEVWTKSLAVTIQIKTFRSALPFVMVLYMYNQFQCKAKYNRNVCFWCC